MLYVTSILAHYSQTSCVDAASMPVAGNLSDVFDNFILQTNGLNDSEILEIGGSQVLLLAGFFRDQMQHRHNVRWYDQVGQSFYERAGYYSRDAKRRVLFDHLSESFPSWAIVCRDMSRALREDRFVLRVD